MGTQSCKVSKHLVASTMHFISTSQFSTIRKSIQCSCNHQSQEMNTYHDRQCWTFNVEDMGLGGHKVSWKDDSSSTWSCIRLKTKAYFSLHILKVYCIFFSKAATITYIVRMCFVGNKVADLAVATHTATSFTSLVHERYTTLHYNVLFESTTSCAK
jgi:hypothetical protein